MDDVAPAQAIPGTLSEWKRAAISYFVVVAHWPFTTRCRILAALAKEHIKGSVVRAVEAGEHHR